MAGSGLQGKHAPAPAPATDLPGYLSLPGTCPRPFHVMPRQLPRICLCQATAPVYAHNRLLPPAPASVRAGIMGMWERYKDKGPTPSCDGASPLCGLIQHVRLTKMQRLVPLRGSAAEQQLCLPYPAQNKAAAPN